VTWLHDSAYYFIARAVPAAVGLVLVAALIRILGEADYGAYALAFSGANLISVFCAGWLSQATLRFQPTTRQASLAFQQQLRNASVLIALACAALIVPLFLLADQSLRHSAVVAAAVLLAVGLSTHAVFAASLQSSLRAPVVAAIEVGRALVGLPLALALALLLEPPFVGALLGLAASYLASGWIARRMAGTEAAHGEPQAHDAPTRVSSRELLAYGWMVSVWLAGSLALPFIERLIVTRLLGVEASGLYAATYDIVYRSCGFLMLPLVLSLHPRIMRSSASGDLRGTLNLWRNGILLQLLITIGIVAVIALAWPQLLRISGIPAPAAGAHLVVPLALAGCLWQIALLAHKLLEATLRPGTMVIILFATIVGCSTADLIFARTYGIAGVAYSLAAGGFVYCALVALAGLRQIRLQQRAAAGTVRP
jgi:O-antigen/teichoic acid export membrane protein